MNTPRHSLRVAALVIGSLGLVAVTNGCTAPVGGEQTGTASQDFIRGPFPIDTIWTKTGAADPTSMTCGSDTIPVPPALAGYGCTLGIQWSSVGDAIDDTVGGYAFACQSNVVLPSTLGLPVPTDLLYIEHVTETSTPATCYGIPIDGYTIVLDTFDPLHIGTGGCKGSGCSSY